MKNIDTGERITPFLNLLFGIDSGAMVFLLAITHYDRGGAKLPTNLPFDIPPPHHELTFSWQVLVLALSAAAILIIHAVGLWKHQSQQYQRMVRRFAVLLLAASLVAIGLAGYKIVQNPSLLKAGEQKQKPNE